MKIDLNSDMGEGFGPYRLCDDEAMMRVVSSANIACGFHGGDPETMARMVRLARENGVGIGAHPGLPDRAGFGRREIACQPDELRQQMIYQLGALQAIARAEGMTVGHFSFHAAMGNMVNRDPALADLMMDAIAKVDARLVFLADRAYDAAGKLVARGLPGALVKDEGSVRARVRRFLMEGTVEALDGTIIDMPARSILVHSDTPGSLELARLIRDEIAAAGAELASVSELAS
jgi:UPF0271 protein